FREAAHLRFEVFGDYTPMVHGRVVLDPHVKDHWGLPVARARIRQHTRDRESVEYLTAKGRAILEKMGAENVRSPSIGHESTNLMGGPCRFGDDPATSVLDRDCRAHEVENLYVTDGSFMPSAGSVPFTFTIYANAFRVADRIVARLGGPKPPVPLGAPPAFEREDA
ncbi:MAG: GMC oxidoreductase, partial [Planctomycetota bacterium]